MPTVRSSLQPNYCIHCNLINAYNAVFAVDLDELFGDVQCPVRAGVVDHDDLVVDVTARTHARTHTHTKVPKHRVTSTSVWHTRVHRAQTEEQMAESINGSETQRGMAFCTAWCGVARAA